MDVKLACGDINITEDDNTKATNQAEEKPLSSDDTKLQEDERSNVLCIEEKTQMETVTDSLNLKDRIAQCRKIIESLKTELSEEKAKLQEETKSSEVLLPDQMRLHRGKCYASNMSFSNKYISDTVTGSDTTFLNNPCVDNKLRCDDSLMEYEKQLQRYQDTLTMAQNEKKNAIRKQMLAKVYKLKLMEVENQCNIELLRVKQSMECLEPLKVIVNKWKSNENSSTCDLNSYEQLPRYPELNPISTNDLNIYTDDEKSEFIIPNEDSPHLE